MINVKCTERSHVRIGFAGTVHKRYFGAHARERLANEVRVLEHLERVKCPFVPRLISVDRQELEIVLSYCGYAVQQVGEDRLVELFRELRNYGVEHEDQHVRNVTYNTADGRFYVVDFEFATILPFAAMKQIEDLQQMIARELAGLNDLDESDMLFAY